MNTGTSQSDYVSINLSKVAHGMDLCRTNAHDLLADAEILFAAERHARAYAILHTACEEIAKFSILELAGKRVFLGSPPQWKRFWQRFRSHGSKAAQLNVQLLYLIAESVVVIEPEMMAAIDTLFDRGLTLRNAALYVDLSPDRHFRGPREIDFRALFPVLHIAAKSALKGANQRGVSIEDIERSLREAPNQSAKESMLAVLVNAVERFRAAGIEKEIVIQKILKVYGA